MDMDPSYFRKKIVDLSEEELIALGFIGDAAIPEVRDIVQKIRARPVRHGSVTCLEVNCVKRTSERRQAKDAAGSRVPPIETRYSELSNDPDAFTVVAPNLLSKFEKSFWYNGLSGDPPELLWRSDLETNPFPVPAPGTPFSSLPSKTAHGVFRTPLTAVWHTVAPQIIASIKARGLKFSILAKVRFEIEEEGKEEVLGPVVVWIAIPPGSASASDVRDATPDILKILADAQVTDVVVEWYECMVQRLSG